MHHSLQNTYMFITRSMHPIILNHNTSICGTAITRTNMAARLVFSLLFILVNLPFYILVNRLLSGRPPKAQRLPKRAKPILSVFVRAGGETDTKTARAFACMRVLARTGGLFKHRASLSERWGGGFSDVAAMPAGHPRSKRDLCPAD